MRFPADALPFDVQTLERFIPDWTDEKNWHEAANIFPLMDDAQLSQLAEGIKRDGLKEPIVLFEGKVLDGRNRVRACALAGVKPTFVTKKPVSPLVFVAQANLHRLHLTQGQKAGVAAKLLPRFQYEAQHRQKAAGKYGAEGGRGYKKEKPSTQKYAKGLGKAAQQAGAAFGVSASYVERAIKIGKTNPAMLDRLVNREITIQQADKEVHSRGSLSDRFSQSPFSVLDAQAASWMERKQFWRSHGAVGTHNEQLAPTYAEMEGYANTSSFDPVLAECICLWFCPSAGRVLDPFAGEYVKGIVAAKMGLDYLGIERRSEQVRENEEQVKKIGVLPQPKWVVGDSANMAAVVPESESFDLVFTSPPYYDLERYSKHNKDGSAFGTYEEFMAWYRNIFAQAVARLKRNRFLVVKVGEIRDKKTGFYRNFVGDNIACFKSLGLHYYNEIILFTSRGSVAMRAGNYMDASRKIGKTHQNILCFFKGDNPTTLGEIRRPAISTV